MPMDIDSFSGQRGLTQNNRWEKFLICADSNIVSWKECLKVFDSSVWEDTSKPENGRLPFLQRKIPGHCLV